MFYNNYHGPEAVAEKKTPLPSPREKM